MGNLTESYNQNTWWVGFGVSLLPTPTPSTDTLKDWEVSSIQEEKKDWDFKYMDSKSVECRDWYYTNDQTCKHSSVLHEQSSYQGFLFIVGAGSTERDVCLLCICPRKRRHGNSRQGIQGTQNWRNSTLLCPVVTGNFNREKLKPCH